MISQSNSRIACLRSLEEAQRVSTLAVSGIFAGEVGTQYLLEEAGVPADKAAEIAKESGNMQAGMI